MQTIQVQAKTPELPAGGLMSRLLFFTLLGFLVLVLIGPIVGVLSAVLGVIVALAAVVLALALAALPFAVIGLVAWGIFKGAVGDDQEGAAFGRRFAQFGRGFGSLLENTVRYSDRAFRWTCLKGWTALTSAGRAVRRSYVWTQNTLVGRGRVAGRVLFEALCGAILATGVCLAASHGAVEAIPVGIIGGALVGGAVGWPKASERRLTTPPADVAARFQRAV